MSNKLAKNKQAKQATPKFATVPQATRMGLAQTWSLLKFAVNGAIAAISFLGVLSLRPDVTIDTYGTTNPKDAFAQLFYVQNLSPYNITDVRPSCSPDIVDTLGGGVHGIAFIKPDERVQLLQPQAKTTLSCPLRAEAEYSTITVNPWVQYRTWYGGHYCKGFAFEGVKASDGSYLWKYRGSDSSPCKGRS